MAEDSRSDMQRVGSTLLKTMWQFQAILAAPTFLMLGFLAFDNMFYSHGLLYEFIAEMFTAIFAGAIIFLVMVQRQLREQAGARWTFRFEVLKAGFAAALWVWFLMDAIFGPASHYSGWYSSRERRIASAAVSVILVL
jgi:hypothetical protein